MPSGEEIQRYLTGVWRMMLGKPDGLKLLDLSADGFWNSFFAIVVALPPMVVGWVAYANDLTALGGDFGGRLSLVLRLALVDVTAWVAPLVVLALVVRQVGIADRFVHLVVSSNWASAVIAWMMLPLSLINLLLPGGGTLGDLLSLGFFVAAMVLSWRVTNVAIGKGAAITTAIFTGMFVVSLFAYYLLEAGLSLGPVVHVPAG